MLEYGLCIGDARTHIYNVTLTVGQPAVKQKISLPVWIPGSYLVREFAKHLFGLQASQNGRMVEVRQLDKCSWEVSCQPEHGALTLTWQVYAFDHSVRMAYLDQCRGFANGTSLFFTHTWP